jgi:hypothetical protein
MGLFWAVLTGTMLADLDRAPGTVIVAHHELAAGGVAAVEALFAELGLETTAATVEEMAGESGAGAAAGDGLHRLHRNPAEVADSWRRHLSPADIDRIEEVSGPVLERVSQLRFRLAG